MGAIDVVVFKVCRANDNRLVNDRFKRGRVTINKLAIRREPQQHKHHLLDGEEAGSDCRST